MNLACWRFARKWLEACCAVTSRMDVQPEGCVEWCELVLGRAEEAKHAIWLAAPSLAHRFSTDRRLLSKCLDLSIELSKPTSWDLPVVLFLDARPLQSNCSEQRQPDLRLASHLADATGHVQPTWLRRVDDWRNAGVACGYVLSRGKCR